MQIPNVSLLQMQQNIEKLQADAQTTIQAKANSVDGARV